jgi:Tfp pilus assembly protein PilO
MSLAVRIREARVQAAILLMLAATAAVYFDYQYSYVPQLPLVEQDSTSLAKLRKDNETVRRSIGAMGLPRLQARIHQFLKIRSQIEALVPPADSVQDLLGTLNRAARVSEVELASVHPDSNGTVGQYAKRSWRVSVTGPYERVGAMLATIAGEPHIMRPLKVRVVSDPDPVPRGAEPAVRAQFTVESYWTATGLDTLAAKGGASSGMDNTFGGLAVSGEAPSGIPTPAQTNAATARAMARAQTTQGSTTPGQGAAPGVAPSDRPTYTPIDGGSEVIRKKP